jgi:hypothetical protein
MREEGAIEEGEEPTSEDLRRFDKRRKGKKASNDEWVWPTDPDAKIVQLKNGRTNLAYKATHVVQLQSDFILAAPIHPATTADMHLLVDDVLAAQLNLNAAQVKIEIEEVAADKGFHSAAALELCDAVNLRTYIPEPKMPQARVWTDKPEAQQRAVYQNRRRMKEGKAAGPLAERAGRTLVRARLRRRRHAPLSAPRPSRRDETLSDRRRPQPRPDPAKAVPNRQTAQSARRLRARIAARLPPRPADDHAPNNLRPPTGEPVCR